MNWSSLPRLLRDALFARSGKSRRRPPRRPLFLEALEDRSVPAAGPSAAAAVAVDDWIDTDGSTPVAVSVLANDAPSAGAHLVPASVTLVSPPQHGSAMVNPTSGQIVYTAATTFAGTDSLQYTVRDDSGALSNPATVSVRVNRPVAADDWIDTDGTTPVTVPVLANDADPDGRVHLDPGPAAGELRATRLPVATVALVSGPSHGTATLNLGGTFTYTAAAGFTGTDSFRYTVTDDNGGTSLPATAFVRVNVPTAADDLAAFSGTTPVAVDVLANDTDPDGNSHLVASSVTVVTAPSHGTATVNPATGQITYTAAAGFSGTDTFTYTVSDDNGATSAPATVSMVGSTAGAVNDDFNDTDGTTPVTIDVLANDSAPVSTALVPGSVSVVTAPHGGNALVNPATGQITYTASANFVGTDTFRYTVRDTNGDILGPATVSVRVNRPVAADDWIDTDGTTPVTVPVLANDADPDGPTHIVPASVALVSGPAHGTATRNPDGSFTYTAAAGFTGTDSFRYTVTDDNGGTSLPATAFVRVNVPTAADDFAQATGTTPVSIDVLANDTDPDGNSHLVSGSVTVVTAPSHGTATVNPATGQITYTANAGWVGTDTFTYTVSDDNGATSAPATVVVITAASSSTTPTPPTTPTTPPPPSAVYVNAAWANVPQGTDPDGSGPATAMGTDAFASLQQALDAVAPGGTVNVAAGNYTGSLSISKVVVVHGGGSGNTFVTGTGSGVGLSITGPADVVSGLTVRGFNTGLVARGETYLALTDVGLNGNTFGGGVFNVTTFLFSGGPADETFYVRPGSLARQGNNPLSFSGVHNLTVDGDGGTNRLVVFLDDISTPDRVWLNGSGVARDVNPFLVFYRDSTGGFGGGVALVLGNGNETVIAQGQFTGAPTTIYGQGGDDTFFVGLTASNPMPGLTVDGGAGNDSLAVFDLSGGAALQNVVSVVGQGVVKASYSGGVASQVSYQNLEQVLGNLPETSG
jgi:hypothetical protein